MDNQLTVDLKKQIENRRAKLSEVSANLKSHFVGLDKVIDDIIKNLEVWYVLPQLITRPVIMCLWGMTGVGKTDLVRRLVRELDFTDKFVEIQLDTEDHGNLENSKSIHAVLSASGIEENKPGIILFDEIQRFRTKNFTGEEIHHKRFQDIWTLLSDGRFSCQGTGKNDVVNLLLESLWAQDVRESRTKAIASDEYEDDDDDLPMTEASASRRKYFQSLWSAKSLKATLKLKESLEEIMRWTKETKMSKIYACLDDPNFSVGDDFSKCLIFVCGNLDEAYKMSDLVHDCDLSADLLHKISRQITVIDIKKALKERFRAEQISRLGNVHVIYPSLTEENFRTLISRKVEDVCSRIKATSGIDIATDSTVEDAIYRNGVYPAQGVRPLFSTVSHMFDSVIPTFILAALQENSKHIDIRFANSKMIGVIDGKEYEVDINCNIDKIKSKSNLDKNAIISVHEASHAVAYALLFRTCPCQIKSSLASFEGGYIITHNFSSSKRIAENLCTVYLAGRYGEELIFGNDKVCVGSSNDIAKATEIMSDLLRKQSMGSFKSFRSESSDHESSPYNTDVTETNAKLEEIVADLGKRSFNLLNDHKQFLGLVADHLISNGDIEPEKFCEIAKLWVPDIKVLENDDNIYDTYYDDFLKFTDKM